MIILVNNTWYNIPPYFLIYVIRYLSSYSYKNSSADCDLINISKSIESVMPKLTNFLIKEIYNYEDFKYV